jgi:hypothetical protein
MANPTPRMMGVRTEMLTRPIGIGLDQSFNQSHRFDGRIVIDSLISTRRPSRLATYLSLIVEFGESAFVTA